VKTKPSIHRLPKSFYDSGPMRAFIEPSEEEVNEAVKIIRLRLLKREIAELRLSRLTDRLLFLKRVTTPTATFALGAVTAIALLLLAGCATSGRGSLVLKDGEVYWCVDASSNEVGCYKDGGSTPPTESDQAPE
jgi:hypothetical protein